MRLFTGISLEPSVLTKLTGAQHLLRSSARLKWSPPDNLHVTLKFIGQWPDERLGELQATLDAIPMVPAFPVDVSRFGFFPNPHRPHSFFAGVHAGPELAALAARIDGALAKIGCSPEQRPYTPHITLARIKRDDDVRGLRERIASMANQEFGSFDVTRFHLYESKQSAAGSVYTILASYPEAAA
jgi:2'-5' RNA ligase